MCQEWRGTGVREDDEEVGVYMGRLTCHEILVEEGKGRFSSDHIKSYGHIKVCYS